MRIRLCDLNPFLRYASPTHYKSHNNPVRITDCRIFYVTEGNAELIIKKRHYTLVPNSLFYCCGGSEYNIISPEGFVPICLNFDLTQEHNCHRESFPRQQLPRPDAPVRIPIFFDDVEDSSFLNDHFYLEDARRFAHHIQRIQQEFNGNTLYAPELCSSILKELLLELHRVRKTTAPSKIDLIIHYLETHYAEDISNKTLADLAGYHEYHLNRLFLAYTGTNLHNYLLRVRMNRARQLILNTDIALNAIPEKIGFHSYPHFSAYFKQMFGCSPAQYRKRMQESI